MLIRDRFRVGSVDSDLLKIAKMRTLGDDIAAYRGTMLASAYVEGVTILSVESRSDVHIGAASCLIHLPRWLTHVLSLQAQLILRSVADAWMRLVVGVDRVWCLGFEEVGWEGAIYRGVTPDRGSNEGVGVRDGRARVKSAVLGQISPVYAIRWHYGDVV